MFILLVVRFKSVAARAQSREVPERTARRAEQNVEALRTRRAVPVLREPAEPLVVHDLRPTNDAAWPRVAVDLTGV